MACWSAAYSVRQDQALGGETERFGKERGRNHALRRAFAVDLASGRFVSNLPNRIWMNGRGSVQHALRVQRPESRVDDWRMFSSWCFANGVVLLVLRTRTYRMYSKLLAYDPCRFKERAAVRRCAREPRLEHQQLLSRGGRCLITTSLCEARFFSRTIKEPASNRRLCDSNLPYLRPLRFPI